ncbi:site-specific integrase, partial [Chitinophaga sp. GbtcB8]|uniref:site-specific integrase n=1 Tax=Chitinophaga sp. GbtcB8 TaxID=2824753 RepID=UPI001C30B3B4
TTLLKAPYRWFTLRRNGGSLCPEFTVEELIRLINTDLGNRLNTVRDAFPFSCFTGFAYEDAKQLVTGDLFMGIDGKLWVKTGRIKTDVRESVPLLPIALLILEKYKGHPCRIREGKLVPIYSNQYYNRCLKEIAEKCNIRADLTTHYARHTFATTITLENEVPLVTVAKMLGLKSVRTAEKYAKATQRKISRNMSRLQHELFDEKGNLKAAS